jgi:superfamily I DNA/RNA helicase
MIGTAPALDVPLDRPLIAVIGPAASGKTAALAQRYATLLAADPGLAVPATIVSSAHAESGALLADRIAPLLSGDRARAFAQPGPHRGEPLATLAFALLAEHATQSGLAYDLARIDGIEAETIFERAIAPLFSADWEAYIGPEIDPEVPGLRAPDRFAAAVFRLIAKLRDAGIGPDEFLTRAQRGATEFYANPPNLAAPGLIGATKDEHRASLAVDAGERDHQRRRELDLAKIVAKLYRSYLDAQVAYGCLTATDALAEATRLLDEHPPIAGLVRARYRCAVIDDVHDLHSAEFRFLQRLFGHDLCGVTVAGNPDAALRTFAGARPERVFKAAATTVTLGPGDRVPAQIAAVAQAMLVPGRAIVTGSAVALHRAATLTDEAAFVADRIAALIAAGTAPHEVAVVHRSLRALGPFEDALVERNIPVAIDGEGTLFERHDVLDALAVAWSAADPFAHAWVLRALQLPAFALDDAALAVLCGEPSSAQALLFDLPVDEAYEDRRWERKRDLRLGTNVVRGDRDADLTPAARERVADFRARRLRWQTLANRAPGGATLVEIATDAGLFAPRPGETAARTNRRGDLIESLAAVLDRAVQRTPGIDLAGALRWCERLAQAEGGPLVRAGAGVTVAAVERIAWRRFRHLFAVDLRAGSFPPYYVPDAFLFSQVYGMIPKDNVGDASTSRTAKFTWYSHHANLRETFAREARRTLAVALERADETVTLSASGKPTRGVAAPEFLVELASLYPPLAQARAAAADPLAQTQVLDRRIAARAASALPRTMSLDHALALATCVRCAARVAATARFVSDDGFLARPAGEDSDRTIAMVTIAATVIWGEAHRFPLAPDLSARLARVLAGEDSPVCNPCEQLSDV